MDRLESIVRKRVRDTLLLDTYGSLLTEKQRLACEYTWYEDMSLAETAQSLNVSRQAVHDLITKARENMEEYDAKLSLIAQQQKLATASKLFQAQKGNLPAEFCEALEKLFED